MPPRIEKNDFFISPLFAILKLLRQENIMYSYANLFRQPKQVLMKTFNKYSLRTLISTESFDTSGSGLGLQVLLFDISHT